MEREKLATLALAALLVSTAHAGEIKLHDWPQRFVVQNIPDVEVPVLMDIGLHFSVKGRPKIRLRQVSSGTYTGCTPILVSCNTNAHLSASITPTGAVKGDYSCSMLNWNIDAPGGVAVVCAKVENAERCYAPSVQVAVIKVRVTPR